jgi:hypothetical protein
MTFPPLLGGAHLRANRFINFAWIKRDSALADTIGRDASRLN